MRFAWFKIADLAQKNDKLISRYIYNNPSQSKTLVTHLSITNNDQTKTKN